MKQVQLFLGSFFSVLCLELFIPAQAETGGFGVSPMSIQITPRASSQILTVNNSSSVPMRIQLSAYACEQKLTGEDCSRPTREIIAFPGLVTLAPGEARKIRVGRVIPTDSQEKAYRIFVSQLPGLTRDSQIPKDPGGAKINFRFRYGISVLLLPASPKVDGLIENAHLETRQIRFDVRNTGNVLLSLPTIQFQALDGSGNVVKTGTLGHLTVLAGGTRRVEVPLPNKGCAVIRKILISAPVQQSDQLIKTLKQEVLVPAQSCTEEH